MACDLTKGVGQDTDIPAFQETADKGRGYLEGEPVVFDGNGQQGLNPGGKAVNRDFRFKELSGFCPVGPVTVNGSLHPISTFLLVVIYHKLNSNILRWQQHK